MEDFTHIAKGLDKDKLIEELNTCFASFDQIMEKRNILKLKTLGDAYMAASGIPEESPTSAVDIVLAALEMQNFIQAKYEEKTAQSEPYWQLRVGINTGYATSGVVGYRKFSYDIWGETVNQAKFLETQGEARAITIGETTYELVQDFFDCEEVRAAQIKHKGEIRRFVVKGIKVHLSEEALGKVPNAEFWQRHQAL